jgi:hypothetical protein
MDTKLIGLNIYVIQIIIKYFVELHTYTPRHRLLDLLSIYRSIIYVYYSLIIYIIKVCIHIPNLTCIYCTICYI